MFHPAEPNSGIRFQRMDLPGKPIVDAVASNRIEMSLRTRISDSLQSVVVDMVEHVLAALYAAKIDNCLIQCDAEEMPGFDGSCLPISLALRSAGVEVQPESREVIVIQTPTRVESNGSWIEALPSNEPGLKLEYRLVFSDDSPIRSTTFRTRLAPDTFFEDVAPARTFIRHEDALALQSKGIATHVTNQDLLVVGNQGPIDNTLRFHDEYARHKLLDLVGDLALCGADLSGTVIACKSGHSLNGSLAAKLRHSAEMARCTIASQRAA